MFIKIRYIVIFLVMFVSISYSEVSQGDALIAAVSNHNYETVKVLIEKGAPVNYKTPTAGISPLYAASLNNDTRIAAFLISKGADINSRNDLSGKTPLMIALEYRNVDCAKILIFAGADSTLRDYINQISAYEIAEDKGLTELFSGTEEIIADSFIIQNNQASLRQSEQNKSEVQIADHFELNWTRDSELFRLIFRKDTSGALVQLSNGASINGRDPVGVPLFNYIVQKRDTILFEFALQNGADIAIRDWSGNTPLITAGIYGNIEAVTRLIENGADINELNFDSASVLFFVCQQGNEELAKLLLEKGANPNIQLKSGVWRGFTPLMAAVVKDNAVIVKALLDAGADIRMKNFNGWTAYKIAKANNRTFPEMLIRLEAEKHGLNP